MIREESNFQVEPVRVGRWGGTGVNAGEMGVRCRKMVDVTSRAQL
jgi:hypothetical protein